MSTLPEWLEATYARLRSTRDQQPGTTAVPELLRYEHELNLPHDEYIDLFLTEVTR